MPIYLAQSGKIIHAIASDINKLPLRSAADNIDCYGLSAIIETRLSNGLKKITPEEVDTVVIAGMGGELIANILRENKFNKYNQTDFILQPMTKSMYLRSFLIDNGFGIIKEEAVISKHKVYVVMKVKFTGQIHQCDVLYPYIGELKLDNLSNATKLYLKNQIKDLKNRQKGNSSTQVSDIILALEKILHK